MSGSLLELSSVSLSFGGLRAVNNVSFTVEPRQITSLIGPNGAGKTTVFNIISGFLRAQEGKILFLGQEIRDRKPHQIARLGIGRTFQAPRVYDEMTVLENVMVGLRQKGENPFWAIVRGRSTNSKWRAVRERSQETLKRVGLAHRVADRAGQLSFGEQRYLSIARTLVSEPALIMMDEPTVGLDEAGLARLSEILRAIVADRSATLLLIEHNMEMVMTLSDRVHLLVQGSVATSGAPHEVKTHRSMIEAYLGKAHAA
jgi:branched-chain amino acid transport system ATP-binding protein